MLSAIETDLFQSLKQLPCFNSYHLIDIDKLVGGFSHQVYKVTCTSQQSTHVKTAIKQSHQFVAKLIKGKATAKAEVAAAHLACRQGITADVVYSDNTWLITRYISGNTLEELAGTVNEKLALCLPLLAKFHHNEVGNLADDTPFLSLNVVEVIKALQAKCDLTEAQNVLLFAIVCEYQVVLNSQHKKVLVHGDLNFANVMKVAEAELTHRVDKKRDSAVLIDFEAAAIASIEYDLGMLLAINRITPKSLALNLKYYGTKADINLTMVTRYAILSCLINGLWYLCNATSKGGTFKQKALQQFDFFDLLTGKKHGLLEQMR